MPNQRDGIMRFRLFKKTPTVHLIKRKGGPPSPKTLPANERKALFWHKWLGSSLVTFVIYGHAVFMSVVYFLVMLWPPYPQAFIVTNWTADILPHSIVGDIGGYIRITKPIFAMSMLILMSEKPGFVSEKESCD